MSGSSLRVIAALAPLALVPVLIYLIGEGILNFGGGEKDLIWVVPWALWSVLFAASSFLLWRRDWSLQRAILRSAMVGLTGVVLVAFVLAVFGQLGVGAVF